MGDAGVPANREGRPYVVVSADMHASPDSLDDFFRLGYRGARFSFGYAACPDLEERAKVVRLLAPERIGVELSEGFQLVPEQATDALVAHHPEAKYFSV